MRNPFCPACSTNVLHINSTPAAICFIQILSNYANLQSFSHHSLVTLFKTLAFVTSLVPLLVSLVCLVRSPQSSYWNHLMITFNSILCGSKTSPNSLYFIWSTSHPPSLLLPSQNHGTFLHPSTPLCQILSIYMDLLKSSVVTLSLTNARNFLASSTIITSDFNIVHLTVIVRPAQLKPIILFSVKCHSFSIMILYKLHSHHSLIPRSSVALLIYSIYFIQETYYQHSKW